MRWEKSVCGGGVGAVESKSKMLNQELEYGSAIADDNVRGEACDKMLGIWWRNKVRRVWEGKTEVWMLDGSVS